jgi:TRAP-type C4-dicarboxylate transport system substrate-binding protein
VDANYTALTSYYKYRLYEVGSEEKTLWVIPRFTGTTGLITFNIKSWNKLPADVQKTISQIGRTGFSKVISDNVTTEEIANLKAISKMGVHVTTISKDDIKYWTQLSQQNCVDKWLSETAKENSVAKNLMTRTKALIEKFSK